MSWFRNVKCKNGSLFYCHIYNPIFFIFVLFRYLSVHFETVHESLNVYTCKSKRRSVFLKNNNIKYFLEDRYLIDDFINLFYLIYISLPLFFLPHCPFTSSWTSPFWFPESLFYSRLSIDCITSGLWFYDIFLIWFKFWTVYSKSLCQVFNRG